MALKFKQRGHDPKKVLIYGEDKSGKSTFAETYCKENGLKAVVIDIDDTNYTSLPILALNLKNDIAGYNNIKKAIADIVADGSFDTIIIDGVSSMIELFVSKAKGIKKYGDRAERFSDILRDLLNSGMNLIFIGQIDMKVIHTEDFQSPKPIVKINSIVNEKYKTYHTKKGYSHKVIACRVWEGPAPTPEPTPEVPRQEQVQEDFVSAGEVGDPDPDDLLRSQAMSIKDMLEQEGTAVTKHSMKLKVVKLVKNGDFPADGKHALLQYITKHCPEELEE